MNAGSSLEAIRFRFAVCAEHLHWDRATRIKARVSIEHLEKVAKILEAFRSMATPNHEGEFWLEAYGVIQALQVQQDAVKTLVQAFGLPFASEPQWGKIRHIRNSAVGHPILRDKGVDPASYSTTRESRDSWQFTLRTFRHDGWPEEDLTVGILDSIIAQQEIVGRALGRIAERARSFEAESDRGGTHGDA